MIEGSLSSQIDWFLDRQTRQAASGLAILDRGLKLALVAILTVLECLIRIANCAFRIAVSNRRGAPVLNRAFLNLRKLFFWIARFRPC